MSRDGSRRPLPLHSNTGGRLVLLTWRRRRPSLTIKHLLAILVLMLLLMHVQSAHGRIYTRRLEVWYNTQDVVPFALMDRAFGFLPKGEVHFTMNCGSQEPHGSPQFWLLFCSTTDAWELQRMSQEQLRFDCKSLNEGHKLLRTDAAFSMRERIEHDVAQHNGRYTYNLTIDKANFFRIVLLQCPDSELNDTISKNVRSCQNTLVALNPDGTQLSSDEIPLPLIYTAINLIWATLMAAWFFNWVIYFKFSNRLHRLISCPPIFKVILVGLSLIWWQEIASTGMESNDISAVKHFVQSIEDALLFITQMVVAEGWGVVRCHIKHYRWTSLLLLFVIFATSLMCVNWAHQYFLALSVCCGIFMMYKTLKWSSDNIELLRRRRRKIRRFITRHNLRYKGACTIDMQLGQKLMIYHRFRIVCASFSMIYAIARTLAAFLHEYTYIKALTFEVPKLLVYLVIGLLFRLRNFEPYENIELVPPKENVVVFELPDCCFGEVQPHVVLGVPLHFKVEKETQTPRRRWPTIK